MFNTIDLQLDRYAQLEPVSSGLRRACEEARKIEFENPMIAPVLVPFIETSMQTGHVLLDAIQKEYGDAFTWRSCHRGLAKNLMEHLLFRTSQIAPAVVFLDFGSNAGENPRDHRASGVTLEGLAAILMHPQWVQSVRNHKAPSVWIPGFQPLGVHGQDVSGGLCLYLTQKDDPPAPCHLVLGDIGHYSDCRATVLKACIVISS